MGGLLPALYGDAIFMHLNNSPNHAWYNIKPSISHLRIWGCIVTLKSLHPKSWKITLLTATLWVLQKVNY
jgi:hypothetical protein